MSLYKKVTGLLTKKDWGLLNGTFIMFFVFIVRGIFSYLYLLIAVRLLGVTQYGSFSVLYSGFTIISFVLGQAFETLISKYVAEAKSKGQNLSVIFKKTLTIFGIVTVLLCFTALLLKNLFVQRLFPEAPYLFWYMVLIGIMESMDMTTRGVLRGSKAIGFYGISFVLNMAFRFLTLLMFVQQLDMGLQGAAVGLSITMMISVVFNMFFISKSRTVSSEQQQSTEGTNLGQYFISMIFMYTFMALYYHSGPILIKASQEINAAMLSGMFMLAAYLTRIPAQLAEAFTVNLLPHLSDVKLQNDLQKSWRFIQVSYMILIPLGILSILGLIIVGPWFMQLFSGEYSYTRMGIGLLAANGFLIILINIPAQLLLSRSKTVLVAINWLLGCLIFMGFSFVKALPVLTRLELGYFVSAVVMFLIMYLGAKIETRRYNPISGTHENSQQK